MARIQIKWNSLQAAHATISKIYAYATPEEIDLKVRLMVLCGLHIVAD